jgi:hypothetical protein
MKCRLAPDRSLTPTLTQRERASRSAFGAYFHGNLLARYFLRARRTTATFCDLDLHPLPAAGGDPFIPDRVGSGPAPGFFHRPLLEFHGIAIAHEKLGLRAVAGRAAYHRQTGFEHLLDGKVPGAVIAGQFGNAVLSKRLHRSRA